MAVCWTHGFSSDLCLLPTPWGAGGEPREVPCVPSEPEQLCNKHLLAQPLPSMKCNVFAFQIKKFHAKKEKKIKSHNCWGATHKVENNNTKEVLTLLPRFQAPHQTSQPGDATKGLGIPRESDFEGQWDLITELPQTWGKQRLLKDTNKTLCTPGPRGKEQ